MAAVSDTITHAAALAMEYPFRRAYTPDSAVSAAFAAIRAHKPRLARAAYTIGNIKGLHPSKLKFDGVSTIYSVDAADYATMTWLSDYFNERQRLKARRIDEPLSPYDYWCANKATIVAVLPNPVSVQAISDAVYAKVRGCGNFRPYLLTGMIRHFGAKTVLDPSAGWGDRLIGAIAAGVDRYVGVDPNAELHAGYAEIITRFGADPAKFETIPAPFQDFTTAESFDLVFTSPPYFNHEIYSTDATQSVVEFPLLDDWFEGFLMVLVKKSLAALNPNGHLVIVINDGSSKYTERLLAAVAALGAEYGNVEYRGVISYAERAKNGYRSPQPMWIWRKTG